jgi:hypothetical protein
MAVVPAAVMVAMTAVMLASSCYKLLLEAPQARLDHNFHGVEGGNGPPGAWLAREDGTADPPATWARPAGRCMLTLNPRAGCRPCRLR